MRHFQFALLSLVLVLAAQPLLAATYYVGTCKNGAFSDIQTAVNTVPAGSTIDVCPGTYPQQIVLNKALTLQSISFNNSSQAIITVPNTGLTTTTSTLSTGYPVAPQVEVTAGPVKITGITVDGTASSNCPGLPLVGIFYSSGSSGTVNEVETRNQNCNGLGVGIIVENGAGTAQSVTIENSDVNSFDYVGIWACSNQTPTTTLTALIKSNNIAGGSYGIVTGCNGVLSTTAGSVSGNNISAFSNGGVVANSASSATSGNNISGGGAASTGILVGASGSVTSNHIFTQGSVGIEFGCNSATVSGNTINGAATGIDQVPVAFTGVNNFYNVATVRVGGAC